MENCWACACACAARPATRAADAALLVQAVDEAFYVPQRLGRRASIVETLGAMDMLTRAHERRAVIDGMGWLSPALASDPAGFAAACEQTLRLMPGRGWTLLRPSWPGAYPDPVAPQCFHVMPFGPSWADDVREHARAVCGELGLVYRRGDDGQSARKCLKHGGRERVGARSVNVDVSRVVDASDGIWIANEREETDVWIV